MRKAIGRKLLSCEIMLTLTTEVEGAMNYHPLMYVHNETEGPVAITTADIIRGKQRLRSSGASWGGGIEDAWRSSQQFSGDRWSQWHEEYLKVISGALLFKGHERQQIREGHLVLLGDKKHRSFWGRQQIREGQLVLLGDKKHGSCWNMCKVEISHPGLDAIIRACPLRALVSTTEKVEQFLYNLKDASQ